MIDFPASVHRDVYENSLIAVDQEDYDRLYADGWRLSEDFLHGEGDPEPDQPVKRKRGRPPVKTQE